MAASLTKEQLKNELISHGVQPPVQSARKEEFIKLYEQHVAPIVSQKGDFSSDEETEPLPDNKVPAVNTSLVANGVDVSALTDEELYEKLQGFGVPVGPILESTRGVYRRKLAALLQNGLPKEQENTNGDGHQEDKYSDSEEEQELEEPEMVQSAVEPQSAAPEPQVVDSAPVVEPASPTPEPLTSVRKRNVDRPPSSLNALPLVDKQGTPTPRPSIRSVTGTASSYSFESRRLLDTTDGKPEPSCAETPTLPVNNIRYILIAVIVSLFFIIVFLYADQLKPLVENVKSSIFNYVEKVEEVAEKMDHAKPNSMPDVN